MPDLARQSCALGSRPALVLVDMMRGFTDPRSPLGCECAAVVDACARLLAAFRARHLPIVYTAVVYERDDQARVFRARLPALNTLRRGSVAVQIDARLTPRPGEPVVEKHYASGFFATDLARRLAARAADSLVVGGLSSSGCVRATVLDGLQHEYPVWVPREAVGDRNEQAHAANLHDLHAKYAEVLSLQEALNAVEALP